ncbi:MAG TPA: class I SAM-dependent methyltransferase [Plantibacter sp.]|uniref:class I SAM-dependent methyltransferase n=1 Tax=Plantibacter sp. TaxID=1871045 RepID=UPI002B8DEB26|nr:class I SAM-dependent methyltransferase [Plantibacter sp.]
MSDAHEPLERTLRRLKVERDEADQRYNEALTALDGAVAPPVGLPDAALALDDQQVAPLNDNWNILPAPPASSWTGRTMTAFVWAIVAPYLQRQLTFNSLLVDHINRNADAQRAAHRRDQDMVASLRGQLEQATVFQSRLMLLLQQITGYVDTKNRDSAGGSLVLNAALSELAEGQAKYRESLAARDHRSEARVAALPGAVDELRAMVGVVQQAIVALKRHLTVAGSTVQGSTVQSSSVPDGSTVSAGATGAFAASLDAYKYVGFEDQFRGSREVIRERLESYLPYFDRFRHTPGESSVTGDVLDVGCGRGEFLDLLKARGVAARGIDLNHEMAEVCRARGLDVVEADAVGHLASLPDQSLGGIFAAQVVEHLEPSYLLQFLELAFEKLQPGGRLVLETLNPACWVAFFESYIRDITHRWPLHPDTLKFLVLASGFSKADVEFRSPVPPHDRLQTVQLPATADQTMREVVETLNGNVERLNARMFTHMDYAVVGAKAGGAR